MATSVWGTGSSHRGTNLASTVDGLAYTLVFLPKIPALPLPCDSVHYRGEGTNCLVLSIQVEYVVPSSTGVREHSHKIFQSQFVHREQIRDE